MKGTVLCLLLLSACGDGASYDYTVSWTCRSSEGCERTEDLEAIDRLDITDNWFFFVSSRDPSFKAIAQRVRSDSLPAECFWLYGMALFGEELEPIKTCNVSGGFDLELSIPNRNPATHSLWLVEVRELDLF